VCGPGCIDTLFDTLQSKARAHARAVLLSARLTASAQVGPDVPCTESLTQCVSGITGPFLAAKGNLQALLGCNRNDIAARLQPKVQCKGTKPTLEQVKSQING
jgi:hypothetical protein